MFALIPDNQIVFSTELAVTIGLEECILLSQLHHNCAWLNSTNENDYHWFDIQGKMLLKQFPFWTMKDCQRILNNLRDLGIILIASPPLSEHSNVRLAFNDSVKITNNPSVLESIADQKNNPPVPIKTVTGNSSLSPSTSANPINSGYKMGTVISLTWKPGEACFKRTAQHNIPREFALEQVEEFISYWRERAVVQVSWNNQFVSHCIKRWQNFEIQQNKVKRAQSGINQPFDTSNSVEKSTARPMELNWRPSDEAIHMLINLSKIDIQFIEDSIPEFIIYWMETKLKHNAWDARFIKNIKSQWIKLHSTANESQSLPISNDWKPSKNFYEVLQYCNIDSKFSDQLLPEFILYWQERQTTKNSWNSVFLRFAKLRWAEKHSIQNQSRPTREISINEQLSDISWAL